MPANCLTSFGGYQSDQWIASWSSCAACKSTFGARYHRIDRPGCSTIDVLPVSYLALGHPFDRGIKPFPPSLLGLSLGYPFDILLLVAVAESIECRKRFLVFLETRDKIIRNLELLLHRRPGGRARLYTAIVYPNRLLDLPDQCLVFRQVCETGDPSELS